jgi:hypothetical protein
VQGVPIANENRLVVTDALGTTIKSTSMAIWRCPLAWRQASYGSGAVAVTSIYTACRSDMLRALLLPSRASSQRTRLPRATVRRGPGTRLRNVNAAARPRRLQARLPADSARLIIRPVGLVNECRISRYAPGGEPGNSPFVAPAARSLRRSRPRPLRSVLPGVWGFPVVGPRMPFRVGEQVTGPPAVRGELHRLRCAASSSTTA